MKTLLITSLSGFLPGEGHTRAIPCDVRTCSPQLSTFEYNKEGRQTERNARMKRSSYGEPDYAFGQAMLTLRTTIELTQSGVAEHLGVSRKAVGEWEAGLNYPQAAHLKAFIALAAEKQAFPPGREEEEIRALWQAARRKVPLDEAWLAALLSRAEIPPLSQLAVETSDTTSVLAPPARGRPHVDWA